MRWVVWGIRGLKLRTSINLHPVARCLPMLIHRRQCVCQRVQLWPVGTMYTKPDTGTVQLRTMEEFAAGCLICANSMSKPHLLANYIFDLRLTTTDLLKSYCPCMLWMVLAGLLLCCAKIHRTIRRQQSWQLM